MKKFITLFLVLVLSLSAFSVAFAAENYSNDTNTQANTAWEQVQLPVANTGKLACVKADENLSSITGYGDTIEAVQGLYGGSVHREHRFIEGVSFDKDGYLRGATTVQASLEIKDSEQLLRGIKIVRPDFEGTPTLRDLVDALIVERNGSEAAIRGVDQGSNLVAIIRLQNGHINVYLENYGSRGVRLVVDLCVAPSTNNGGNGGDNVTPPSGGDNGGTPPAGGDNGTPPANGTDFTITGEDSNPNAGTDFTIDSTTGSNTGSTTTNNQSSHSGWSEALTGGSAASQSNNSESTGFTID